MSWIDGLLCVAGVGLLLWACAGEGEVFQFRERLRSPRWSALDAFPPSPPGWTYPAGLAGLCLLAFGLWGGLPY